MALTDVRPLVGHHLIEDLLVTRHRGYLADGLTRTDDGFALSCAPAWEASNFVSQSHDPWRAMRTYRKPVRILRADTGSITQMPPHPRGLSHVAVETVPETGHLFPMTRADVVRDALFDAAV